MRDFRKVAADYAGPLLVVAASLLVAVTAMLLPVTAAERELAWLTMTTASVLAAVCWAGAAGRDHSWQLAVYPLIVFGTVTVIGGRTMTFGQAYGGLFSICFVFIGLRMPRGSGAVLAVPAAACWWLTYKSSGSTPHSVLAVRLSIALVIWVATAELLAARAADTLHQHQRLERAAERDPLTGLHNRRLLEGIYSTCQVGDGFMLVDFDYFKAVNDEYGHAAGDRVLTEFAKTLRTTLRRDDLAIRYGGEEILLYLKQPGAELGAIVSRLRESWWRGKPLATYSSGVAVIAHDQPPHTVLARADTLLYAAKAAGRNRDMLDSPAQAGLGLGDLQLPDIPWEEDQEPAIRRRIRRS